MRRWFIRVYMVPAIAIRFCPLNVLHEVLANLGVEHFAIAK
jgi:hypothetical protein